MLRSIPKPGLRSFPFSRISKLTGTSYEGKSATVVAAMKAREQELREKQIKALLVKKEQEAAATVKEQQRQESKEKYQAKLDEWAMEKGGEKKNIRTLLSTVGIERGVERRCTR